MKRSFTRSGKQTSVMRGRTKGQYGCLFEICGHDMKVSCVNTSVYFFL